VKSAKSGGGGHKNPVGEKTWGGGHGANERRERASTPKPKRRGKKKCSRSGGAQDFKKSIKSEKNRRGGEAKVIIFRKGAQNATQKDNFLDFRKKKGAI